MNVGLYQSASALSALERWHDSVAQNITSSQTTGFRKRTINFSTQSAGELRTDPRRPGQADTSMPNLFPKINAGINFNTGEPQTTGRDLDVAIQGEGFFEVQRPDGSKAYAGGRIPAPRRSHPWRAGGLHEGPRNGKRRPGDTVTVRNPVSRRDFAALVVEENRVQVRF